VVAEVAGGLAKTPGIRYALTGSAAAASEARAVTRVALPVEFWVTGPTAPEHLAKVVGGIAAEEGANVILWCPGSRGPMARTRRNGITLASEFRIYADLLADPRRGKEQAAYYRESVIKF
jgi:hypothetical protein